MDESELGGALVENALRASQADKTFETILAQALTTANGVLPSPVWDAIRTIDLRADVRGLTEWTRQKLTEDPPHDLSALWFGLSEMGAADRYPNDAEAVLQLSGGPGYPDDDEWPFKQNWRADGYAPTPGLRSLLQIGATGGDTVFGVVSYAIVFTYVVGLVTTALDDADPPVIRPEWPRLAIAAGFHDGDTAELGVLTGAGLDRSKTRWI